MSRFFKIYELFLHRYPVISQSLQTGILVSAGDVISQTVVEKHKFQEYSFKRTLQYFCVGAVYLGPVLTMWYRILETRVGSGGKFFALKKMAIDQICFAPVCLAGFIISVDMLRGNSIEETKYTFKNVYPDILINNYRLWPAVQLVNFYYVPLRYQVLYVQCFALFWNTYVCFKTKPEDTA